MMTRSGLLCAATLTACVPAEPTSAQSAATPRDELRALIVDGRYEEAETRGRRLAAAEPGSVALWNTIGEALQHQGKLAAAESAFTRAAAGAPDSLTARLNLAVLHHRRGEREAATRLFDSFIDVYNRHAARLTAEELLAVGTACRYLGADDPQLFKDALRAYDDALARDSNDLEPRLLAGELFLEKYNSADAGTEFAAVLRRDPEHARALHGMARRAQFDGAPEATGLVRRSLAANPNLVPARVLLATLHLEAGDHDAAAAEAERALATDPASLEALAVLAAVHRSRGDTRRFDEVRRRALALNPRDAELYVVAAELSARGRRYADAVALAAQAVALDPRSWRGWSVLGINQLRTGAMAEGRRSLETSFAGDPYNVWSKNTLDLLDALGKFRQIRTPRFLLVVDPKEAELLSLYLGELAEAAYDTLARRYDYRPPAPIRLEIYPRHADFSVRTVGLAGLGALGASFGTVLAMDAPSARERGSFNWGSTAWHEIAHTFTLGATAHRVPRWLTEGLSVYEERRARPGWGAQATPDFIDALRDGKLLSIERLNDGFVRPSYPGQVMVSYYQASLVVEFIEQEWGERRLRDLVLGQRSGASTAELAQRILGVDLTELDRRFQRGLRERFGAALAVDPERFAEALARGRELVAARRWDEAVTALEAAKAQFPDYAGPDSPGRYLAAVHRERGALREAAAELEAVVRLNDSDYDGNVELATILEQIGDSAGAAAALERAIYIFPYAIPVHERLAALYQRLGRADLVVRERRAVVALAPVDRPEALYRLALAYRAAGDRSAARREVLGALETAPGFEKAQELLLELREREPTP